MSASLPVVGALDPVSAGGELLVVEAYPESGATRACKGIARHVYRFAQEVRWAGGERAVAIRVLGEPCVADLVGTNLALLLAPLLDIGLEASDAVLAAFEIDSADDGEHENPRDRLRLVPTAEVSGSEAADRYEMTIGSASSVGIDGADLVLIVVSPGTERVELPTADSLTEFAVVIAGGVDEPVPEQLEIA